MLTLLRVLLPVILAVATVLLSLMRQAQAAEPPRMPSDAEMNAQRGVMPRIPSVPDGARSAQGTNNLADLAEQYERLRRGPGAGGQADKDDPGKGPRNASGLMIFLSLSMPEPTIRALIADAKRARALLVLRGVQDSSLRKTTERIEALMGKTHTAWNIDPALFERFAVTAVPSFVLIDPHRPVLLDCGADKCQGTAFSKVSGDVSITYALQAIVDQDAEFSGLAKAFIGRLTTRSGS